MNESKGEIKVLLIEAVCMVGGCVFDAWSVAAFLMRDVMVEQTNKVEVVCVCVCR
jgi:hypothetical protein